MTWNQNPVHKQDIKQTLQQVSARMYPQVYLNVKIRFPYVYKRYNSIAITIIIKVKCIKR